jgi:tetratricopeptide (TPR) repeat protein
MPAISPLPSARPSPVTAALASALLVLAAHGSSLFAGFVWDDRHTVVANPALEGPAALLASFTRDDWAGYGLRARGVYRPLATTSLFADRTAWGTRAFGFHLSSLALHAFVAFAIARILAYRGVRPMVCLGAAALFAVHPLGSEVADWVSARPDGLATSLSLAALLLAARGRLRTAAALAVAAPFAKESGVAAIPSTLLLVLLESSGAVRRQALGILAAGATAYGAARVAAGVRSDHVGAAVASPSEALVAVARFGDAVAGWARAALWPLPLDAVRPLADAGPWRWGAAAAAVLIVLLALLRAGRRGDPWPAALAVLWALPLALASLYGAGLSERYLHLPLASAIAALALGIDGALRAVPGAPSSRLLRLAGLASLTILLVDFVAADRVRAREWSNTRALFAGATRASPGNPEAWQLLGAALHADGDRRGALEAFERAAALGSERAGLWSNLCAVRRELGNLSAAGPSCERAVALDPLDPRPRYNRALLLAARGDADGASAELRAIVREFPGYRPAREALGRLPSPDAR